MTGVIKKILFKKEYSLARHILFWLLYLFVFTLMSYEETSGFGDTFKTAFLFFPINILYAYIILYWFVPKYLLTGKYLNFFCAYCIWATADLILIFFYRYYVLYPMWTGKAALPFDLSRSYREIFEVWGFIGSNTVAMFAVFIRMFKYWHSEQLQKLQIQQEKTKAEQIGRVWMSIELSVKNEQLFFRVINSADWALSAPVAGGIGINNVRRRLELLYPGNYSLTRDAGQDVYIVSLTIELGLSVPVRNWLTLDAGEHILYEDPMFDYR
jgi:hypothetical protein